MISRSFLLVLLAVVFVWATEPWEKKPYTEWSMKDVEKMLNDSPWAHQVVGLEGVGLPYVEKQRVGSGTQSGEPVGITVWTAHPGVTETQLLCVVRWWSSLTVRQAVARRAQLKGGASEQELHELLARKFNRYVITLSAAVRLFGNMEKEELLRAAGTSTYLEVGPNNGKISPSEVQLRYQEGALVFYFPHMVHGEPLIHPDQKTIKFVCQGPNARIAIKFDLRKMVRDGTLDL